MPSTSNILLVGGGKMGSALVEGWIDQGTPPQAIFVVDPALPSLPDAVSGGVSIEDVPDDFTPGVIVLAVKPQVMDDVAAPYRKFAGPEVVFLSIAAGRNIASFEALLGEGAAIVRAMPNTPAAVGARGHRAVCERPGFQQATGHVRKPAFRCRCGRLGR